MASAAINGISYHYVVIGSGPPLVLLHGFTGSSENWQPHTSLLAEHFTVLTVDLLGHGETDAPHDPERYGMAQAAADLVELLDRTCKAPAHVLGYSMGGRLALYLAMMYPELVSSLILESASPGLADAPARRARIGQDEALADRIEAEGLDAFVDYWETLPLFATQQRLPVVLRRHLRDQRLRNRTTGLANTLRGMGTGVQPSLWEHLHEVSMSVLLLAGALDTKFVGIARQMYDLLPEAHLAIVPDAGHTIHLESPDAFRIQLLQFLAHV